MLGVVLRYIFVFGVPILIIGISYWYEAGFRAYSKGRGYHDGTGFRLNEEKEGRPGKRKIAWIPTKTKYGYIWLDYIWKDET